MRVEIEGTHKGSFVDVQIKTELQTKNLPDLTVSYILKSS